MKNSMLFKPADSATALPAPAMRCRAIPSSNVHEVMTLWRFLERRLNNRSLACSATWVEEWLEVYGSVVPYYFLVGEVEGTVCGICLLTSGAGQKMGPFSVKTQHIGTAGEPQPGSVCVEFNRILVAPEYHADFVSEIVTHIFKDRQWEQFRLDGFSERDLQAWLPYFPGAEIRSRDSRFFDLGTVRENRGNVIDALGKSTRSNLRRRLKQYGELECEWAEQLEQAQEILEELIDLHQARWQSAGEPGAFASERFRRFQTKVLLKLFLEGKTAFFRVRHQGQTVGCLLLLVDENRLLDYLSGFADFNQKPSPGLTTHYLCMEEALKRGYDAYDFLVGDKRHKDNLSNAVGQLCWLNWSRPSSKQKLLAALRSLKQCVGRRTSGSHQKSPAQEVTLLESKNS